MGAVGVVLVALGAVHAITAILAFSQMLRIHLRNPHHRCTRQKMFHFMIAASNFGNTLYFASIPVADCVRWFCWSRGCGFILMACPQILSLAAFLVLLSFWVDLCHQANDEDEDDDETSYTVALLEKSKKRSGDSNMSSRRRCCNLPTIHVGSRQKIVILVVTLAFIFMFTFALLIWIGKGKNPIDSLLMAMLYLDAFSAVTLLSGGALAFYGGLLYSKMRKVKSEMVSAEMRKVATLAFASPLCFAISSVLALVTNIPLLVVPGFRSKQSDNISTSVLLLLYYLIGSSLPSAVVLWVMREMPPRHAAQGSAERRVVTFVREQSPKHDPCRWTAATTSMIQASRASPI